MSPCTSVANPAAAAMSTGDTIFIAREQKLFAKLLLQLWFGRVWRNTWLLNFPFMPSRLHRIFYDVCLVLYAPQVFGIWKHLYISIYIYTDVKNNGKEQYCAIFFWNRVCISDDFLNTKIIWYELNYTRIHRSSL